MSAAGTVPTAMTVPVPAHLPKAVHATNAKAVPARTVRSSAANAAVQAKKPVLVRSAKRNLTSLTMNSAICFP